MKNEDNSISVIRLISMLMIIACHILQGLNNTWAFWINVGVQMFFFISGFLYGKKKIENVKEFYIKRVKKVLIPYLIVLIISLFLEYFILHNRYSFHRIFGCFIGMGAFVGNISILYHTWFISYILICYLLTPILQNVFKNKKFKDNFLIFLFIMFLVYSLKRFNAINIESSWINNFIIGYFYGKCCKNKKQKKIFEILIFTIFILIIPFAIIYQEKLPVLLPGMFNSRSDIIINYGHVLLGCILFVILYKILNKLKIKKNMILSFSDKYSYYIYLVHQIFILNSFSVLFLTENLAINIFLILLFSIIAALHIKRFSDITLTVIDYLFNKFKKAN